MWTNGTTIGRPSWTSITEGFEEMALSMTFPRLDHRVKWRADQLEAGRCGNCGKAPLAVNQKTGYPATRCNVCMRKTRLYNWRRRGKLGWLEDGAA